MTEFVSGIKPITPSYPVKPVQPANKDREQSKQPNRQLPTEDKQREPDDDPDDKPIIDEHV